MFLFRSKKVGDKPQRAAVAEANANSSGTKTTAVQIENTGPGRSPATTDESPSSPELASHPATTSEPKAPPGSAGRPKSWRARCCICSKQGPTTANHCACFHTSPQHVARVAAKISIMMNIIPVLYIILSLRIEEEDVIPGKIYGSVAFIVCSLILLGLSALLVVGISKKKPRLGIPWIICQTLMLVFIIALAVINYRNYEKSVPVHHHHHHLGNSSMSNSTAATQNLNISSTTPAPNSTANSTTNSSSTPEPAEGEETTNPLTVIYLTVVFYLCYHTILVICLIWMVINFFVGLTFARNGAKVNPDEGEVSSQPQQESAPDSSTPKPGTGASPPDPSSLPTPKSQTINPEVDPETILHDTQQSKFNDYEAELEDV